MTIGLLAPLELGLLLALLLDELDSLEVAGAAGSDEVGAGELDGPPIIVPPD